MPLTDLEIRRSKPREKSYTLNDGNGLSLLIEPNGSRGWRFRYRFDGKPKMISLGTYPDVTLNDARRKRDDARRLVAGGINPSDVRKEEKLAKLSRNQNTFEAIAREWYAKRIDRCLQREQNQLQQARDQQRYRRPENRYPGNGGAAAQPDPLC